MKTLATAAFAATLVLCSTARADTITLQYDNPVWTPLSYDAIAFSTNGGASFVNAPATRHQSTVLGFTGALNGLSFVDNVNDLYLYCYDLFQYINHGQTVTYTVDYAGLTTRTLDYLGAVDYVLNGNTNSWSDPYAWLRPAAVTIGGQPVTATNVAAAIQLGVWESLYETDGGWDLASGQFRATYLDAGTTAAYNAFVNASSAAFLGDPPPELLAMQSVLARLADARRAARRTSDRAP